MLHALSGSPSSAGIESTDVRLSDREETKLSISGSVAFAQPSRTLNNSCQDSGDILEPVLSANLTNAAAPTDAKLWCGRL